jgi:Metallo-beta-lactamase superfamily
MREILPGLFHWTTVHEDINAPVSSYYVQAAGVVIDPRIPDEGLGAFGSLGTPQQIVLTTGLHLRHSEQFAQEFGIPIRAPLQARERLGDRVDFEPYGDADEIAPGVRAIEIDLLCPDEYALHVEVAEGALAIADGITNYGSMGFFADDLLGAHPDRVKEGLRNAYRAQLGRDFDHLLFAHGDPIVGNGKAKLRDFVMSPAGHPEVGQVL